MSKNNLAFAWQKKTIDYFVRSGNDQEKVYEVYGEVSDKFGSGKKHLGDGDRYFSFMERKWQITYLRLLKMEHEEYCNRIGEVYRG